MKSITGIVAVFVLAGISTIHLPYRQPAEWQEVCDEVDEALTDGLYVEEEAEAARMLLDVCIKWQKDRDKFADKTGDKNNVLFRDWNNLQYIFRAFEEFTPWVRKIHLVTFGHLPKWLNVDHPKLNIVKHQDYIDEKYLPVFSSHPLEISMHKINDLSEKFVYFNDDCFVVKPLKGSRFFKNDFPCDMAVGNALSSSSGAGYFVLNAMEVLNRHFDKYSVMKKNPSKWFSAKYGKEMLRNIALLPWPRFTGFVNPHQPQPFLKSIFEELWSKEYDVLEKTMQSKFRSCSDVSQYLFRYWQLASGKFSPISMSDTAYLEITPQAIEDGSIEKALLSQTYSMVCLNDSEEITDSNFEYHKKRLIDYFETLLPQKSSFER